MRSVRLVSTAVLPAIVLAGCSSKAAERVARDTAVAQSAPAATANSADSGAASAPSAVVAANLPAMTVYKSPTCGCCKSWVAHAQSAGFRVTVRDTADVTPVKQQYGVNEKLHSCHTAIVGGYVVEGHVPAEDIARMLRERPKIAGLAVPGMPASAPGMDMGHEPYEVLAFTKDGKTSVYARH